MTEYEGHTPGPWAFDGIESCTVFNRESGEMVAETLERFDDGEEIANAALIAAAPDLLEENKRLRHDLERANNALADERELPTIAYMSGAADANEEIKRLKAINAELVEALVKIEGAVHGLYGDAEQSLSIIGGIVGEALTKAKEHDDE
jgi:uncharacterized protein YicC (UPF0701 family)